MYELCFFSALITVTLAYTHLYAHTHTHTHTLTPPYANIHTSHYTLFLLSRVLTRHYLLYSSSALLIRIVESTKGVRQALHICDDEDLAQGDQLETVANLHPVIKYSDSLSNSHNSLC